MPPTPRPTEIHNVTVSPPYLEAFDIASREVMITLILSCGQWATEGNLTMSFFKLVTCEPGVSCSLHHHNLFQTAQYILFHASSQTLTIQLKTTTSLEVLLDEVWVFTIWGDDVVHSGYPEDPFETRLTVKAQAKLAAAVATAAKSSTVHSVVSNAFAAMMLPSTQIVSAKMMSTFSDMSCSREAQRHISKPVIPLEFKSISDDNVRTLTRNYVVMAVVGVGLRLAVWALETLSNDYPHSRALQMISFPHLLWVVVCMLYPSTVFHSFRLLEARRSQESFTYGVVSTLLVAVAFPVALHKWHKDTFGGVFLVYPRHVMFPPYLFYTGAWGPNFIGKCSGTFVINLKPDKVAWNVAPFVASIIMGGIAAFQPMSPDGCRVQAIILSSCLSLYSATFFFFRPQRWWFLDVALGVSTLFQAVQMAMNAVILGDGAPQHVAVVSAYFVMAANYFDAVTGAVMGIVSVMEIFFLRQGIWPDEDRVTIAELTNAVLLLRQRERRERTTARSEEGAPMQEMSEVLLPPPPPVSI